MGIKTQNTLILINHISKSISNLLYLQDVFFFNGTKVNITLLNLTAINIQISLLAWVGINL